MGFGKKDHLLYSQNKDKILRRVFCVIFFDIFFIWILKMFLTVIPQN